MLTPISPLYFPKEPLSPLLYRYEHDQTYLVRRIDWEDTLRQEEYQRLRAEIFIKSLGWQLPMDGECERDRYDVQKSSAINVYGVYGTGQEGQEELLGGIRIFCLQRWHDSMTVNEFYESGVIPLMAVKKLKEAYECRTVIELTRFCVVRGRWYRSPFLKSTFNCSIVRDLLFACAIETSYRLSRPHALALIDAAYMRVLRRSFVFDEIYSDAVSLITIDPNRTIEAIRASGSIAQAERMLAISSSVTKSTKEGDTSICYP